MSNRVKKCSTAFDKCRKVFNRVQPCPTVSKIIVSNRVYFFRIQKKINSRAIMLDIVRRQSRSAFRFNLRLKFQTAFYF